jgi:hypothetical protein
LGAPELGPSDAGSSLGMWTCHAIWREAPTIFPQAMNRQSDQDVAGDRSSASHQIRELMKWMSLLHRCEPTESMMKMLMEIGET